MIPRCAKLGCGGQVLGGQCLLCCREPEPVCERGHMLRPGRPCEVCDARLLFAGGGGGPKRGRPRKEPAGV